VTDISSKHRVPEWEEKAAQQAEKRYNQRCHQQYAAAPATPAALNIDLGRHVPLTLHILKRERPAAMRTVPRIQG
jgi:hypothetical protein